MSVMEKLICPSMMCADYGNLEEEVRRLDRAGVDVFHVDVMDGNFVPNYAMGLEDFKCIRKNTKKLVDVHLMVEKPDTAVNVFGKAGADIIYVHYETDANITRTLCDIKAMGKKAGLALNPGTSFETVKNALALTDYVMVMTVNPGFSGQEYLGFVDSKILEFIEHKEEFAYEIVVDGAISMQRMRGLSKLGVLGFVLGTSSLFGKGDYGETIKKLREL